MEAWGCVAPLVPHSGGGQGGGHLGGQGLAQGLGGQGAGHGGGHGGHGRGHGGGHGGHFGGGGHFSRGHFSEHRCSSFFKQLGWHLVSHFCSHLGSQFLGSFLGSLGLFLSSLDILDFLGPAKKYATGCVWETTLQSGRGPVEAPHASCPSLFSRKLSQDVCRLWTKFSIQGCPLVFLVGW